MTMVAKSLLAGIVFAGSLAVLAGLAMSANEAAPEEGDEFEQAALDFVTWCGPCHGRTGIGDGPVAASLITKPADLTLLKQRAGGEFQAEQVFKRIDGRDFPTAHGTPEMPVWGYWFKQQETAAGLLQEDVVTAEKEVRKRIERLVGYLETIQK